MSMKKAIDQTLRDIKRGVNKNVLKVPSIERKVLDATSNEPWGPHGSLLADIAQATRNYHEYQMIMVVLWKRINDTGKNWRHVYKALTVLEYMVSHGSERVIDDIKEHAYQISTLSEFQYIDSSGKDQGNNVRRKSQSLVSLVNDKERIQEVREKAASNRDKFRSSSAMGGMYRPGSGGYGDDRYEDRYGGRDDDRNGYGRDKDGGFRDDDRYGRYGDSYNREGDRYGRESEDHYGRDSYRDDDSRGRSRSEDDYQYGSRSRSSDRAVDRAYDEDDRQSSRRLERKFSEQNLSAPPSYEEVVGVSRSPTFSERDGETPAATAAQLSSPTVGAAAQSSSPITDAAQSPSPISDVTPQPSPAPNGVSPNQAIVEDGVSSHSIVQADSYDEFDPRGRAPAAPSTSHNAEMDLFGSLADAFTPGPLAIMPAPFEDSDFKVDYMKPPSDAASTEVTSRNTIPNQSFEDPFGDSPFKAITSDELAQPHNFTSTTSFQPSVTTSEHTKEFPVAFPDSAYNPTNGSYVQSPPSQQFFPEAESPQHNDIFAGILPLAAPFATPASQAASPAQTLQPPAGVGQPFPHMDARNMAGQPTQLTRHNSLPYSAPSANSSANIGFQPPNRMSSLPTDDLLGGVEGALALVPHQPAEKKFETKSTVWADTLNRGLVNLNISGSKINPLSDIGIDFDSLNRKEKRMEKPNTTSATSNVSMGKAMGSGSGIGRAGVGALRPTQNQMMGPGMGMGGINSGGMGMACGPGAGMGMGMGNYGPVNVNQQPMGMGMGMGMNMGGMGVNMGMGPMQPPMGQGVPMQPSHGLAPGSNMNNYPMMGRGGYPPQQTYQYGGGYR